jgi:hypothetical protein
MKIRIKGNTIRIRLEEDEISKISLGETVVNTTVFSPLDRLTFSISKWNLTVIGAELKGASTHISIPSALLESRSPNAEFSIEGVIENGLERGLKILIEVDLPCEHK